MYSRWMIHSFTVLVVNVHHTSPSFSGLSRGELNEFSIRASFQGQIGYWSPSLCLLRQTLACQNRSLPWRLPISQCWLILCKLWPATPNQGWWERGGGWLSEVAVMHPGSRCTWAVEQGSALGWCFSLVSLAWHYPQPQFLPSVEKEVDTKRKDIPFIRLEGPEAINTGRVEWWAEAKAVQRLWYYMRKQKKGKSSYCDPVREQQPFWLLFSLRGF